MREQVEQLHAELAEQRQAVGETSAEVERLTGDLKQREEAVAAAHVETADLREEVERLVIELAERERALEEASAEADRLGELPGAGARGRRGREPGGSGRRPTLYTHSSPSVTLRRHCSWRRRRSSPQRSPRSRTRRTGGEEARRNAALAEADPARRRSSRAARARLAEAETALAELQIRRFVRPRTKWLALSQFGSWLTHPHRGGWRLLGAVPAAPPLRHLLCGGVSGENPDVDASGLDPLMHYVEHGIREGRALAPTPSEAIFAADDVAHPRSSRTNPRKRTPGRAEPRSHLRLLRSQLSPSRRERTQAPWPAVPPADYGDFIVLLSRQRSGTTPLRSVLESHPDIFTFKEVFNLSGRDSDQPLLRESNFFTFLERYAKDDVRRTMPDHHERLFLDYLEYLRCLSQKRYTLIDVKYNTTHFLARPWQERGAPYLLELIVKHGLYVLNVTRRNYLRSILSSEKAWHSNCYVVPDGDTAYVDGTRYLDPDFVLRELSHCRDEDHASSRG